MKIIYFLQNHSINLPEIWSDCSIYVCLWLIAIVLLAIWSAKNYNRSVESEYKEVTKTMVNSLNHEIDRLESENSYLKQAFDSYKIDTQRELIELKSKLPKRNSDGTFAVKTGKGHGKKKFDINDLLEKAKRRYPIGTKVICLHDRLEYIIVDYDNDCYDQSIWFNSEDFGICVYKNGVWAKIIKS